MKQASIYDLVQRYGALLFDAYGVLVNHTGPIPGAPELVSFLNSEEIPYYILTNDASKLPETTSKLFGSWGLSVPAEKFITSGLLIKDFFHSSNLQGVPTLVLGTEDSKDYVRQAGGRVVELERGADAEALVLADEVGFDFLAGLNAALNLILRRIDQGLPLALVLANPDLLFPVNRSEFALAAGSMAVILQKVIEARFPNANIRFTPLGKPYEPIFLRARKTCGTNDLLMIGDQLLTDIKGANNFGIDSALVAGGVADLESLTSDSDLPKPTYLLSSFVRG